MSFLGAHVMMPFIGSKEEYQKLMAKREMAKRTANPIKNAVWRLRLKHEIKVKWPTGWTPTDHLGVSRNSSDPNDWYRDWLEHQVGRQGWDWEWRVETIEDQDYVKLKFRKEEHLVLFALKWG